ncbi:MAG TPA: homogentisate 1,2-dioxygenase [Symbiobacteriaceae bacterium]|nr:homogentisate 1,2-dioxygenase [Symbiobacteriaceae bacterium]
MPFYVSRGQVPAKRHVQFRRPDGALYSEQVMGTRGFSGIQSILYHINPPTAVARVEDLGPALREYEETGATRHRHFKTMALEPGGDVVTGRRLLMGNEDVAMALVRPTEPMDYFYRNGDGDEVLFIHEGQGRLQTNYGSLTYRSGDYLVIPIGTTWRMLPDPGVAHRVLVLEAAGSVVPPKRYHNEWGQLLEHSPFCERDMRVPEVLETFDEQGEFEVRVRAAGRMTACFFGHHPLDVVGWDGHLHPYALSIHDFEPITGRIHQPPPVHQTFDGPGFVVCSFVPRLFDYHPQAIPVPYNHSNVDSDEVLYYVDGNFMSRRGIEVASVTLHPRGIPHGPHPGAVEGSLGKEKTEELAVMVDTFRPLRVAKAMLPLEEPNYMRSWLQHS